jgi:hypothetical protein
MFLGFSACFAVLFTEKLVEMITREMVIVTEGLSLLQWADFPVREKYSRQKEKALISVVTFTHDSHF